MMDREYVMAERSFYIMGVEGAGTTDHPYEIDGVTFNGWYYEVGYEFFVHCVNGVQHSDTTHALEDMDGTKIWLYQGRLHRLDGPAVEGADGSKEWWVDGKEVDVVSIFGYEPSVPLTEEEQMLLRLSA